MANKADKIVEQLLDSSKIIAESMVKNLAYDKTYKATVVGTSRAGVGLYSCKLDDLTFTAVGGINEYKVNDIVYVNVPQDNWDNQKNIIGRGYVTSNSSDTSLPFDSLYTSSAQPILASSGEYDLLANKDVFIHPGTLPEKATETKVSVSTVSNLMDYYDKPYTCLGIKALFKTEELTNFPVYQGNYGLRLSLYSSTTSVTPIAIYELNTTNMIGNIYSLHNFTEFQAVFKLDQRVISNIKIAKVELFEDGKFYYSDPNLERTYLVYSTQGTYPTDPKAAPPDGNIHVKDVILQWGFDANDFEGDNLKLATSSNSFYYAHYDNTKYAKNPTAVKNFTYTYLQKDDKGRITEIERPEVTFYKRYGSNNEWTKITTVTGNNEYSYELSTSEMQSTSDSISFKITTPKESYNAETGERYTYIESNIVTFYKFDDGSENSQASHEADDNGDDVTPDNTDALDGRYVPVDRTIAEIPLSADISAEELREQLGIRLASGEGFKTQALRVYRIMKSSDPEHYPDKWFDPLYAPGTSNPCVFALITYYSLGSAVYGNITIQVDQNAGGNPNEFTFDARHPEYPDAGSGYSALPRIYRDTLVIVSPGTTLGPPSEDASTAPTDCGKFVAYPSDETPSAENQVDFPTPGQSVFYSDHQYSIGPGVYGDAKDSNNIIRSGGITDFRLVGDNDSEYIMSIEGYIWGNFGPKRIDGIFMNRPFTYTTADEGYIGLGDNHHNTKMTGYIAHNVGADRINHKNVSFGFDNTVLTGEEDSGSAVFGHTNTIEVNNNTQGILVSGYNNKVSNSSSGLLVHGMENAVVGKGIGKGGLIGGIYNLSYADSKDSSKNGIIYGEFNSSYGKNPLVVGANNQGCLELTYGTQNNVGLLSVQQMKDINLTDLSSPSYVFDHSLIDDPEYSYNGILGSRQIDFDLKKYYLYTDYQNTNYLTFENSGFKIIKDSLQYYKKGSDNETSYFYLAGQTNTYGGAGICVIGTRNNYYASHGNGTTIYNVNIMGYGNKAVGVNCNWGTLICGTYNVVGEPRLDSTGYAYNIHSVVGTNNLVRHIRGSVFGQQNTVAEAWNNPITSFIASSISMLYLNGNHKSLSYYETSLLNNSCIVFGQNTFNCKNTQSTSLGGYHNELINTSYNLIFGQDNRAIKNTYSIVLGYQNYLNYKNLDNTFYANSDIVFYDVYLHKYYKIPSSRGSNSGTSISGSDRQIPLLELEDYTPLHNNSKHTYIEGFFLRSTISGTRPQQYQSLEYEQIYNTGGIYPKTYIGVYRQNSYVNFDPYNTEGQEVGDWVYVEDNDLYYRCQIHVDGYDGTTKIPTPGDEEKYNFEQPETLKWIGYPEPYNYIDSEDTFDLNSDYSFLEGGYNIGAGTGVTTLGYSNYNIGNNSVILGKYNKSIGIGNFSEGYGNISGLDNINSLNCEENFGTGFTDGYLNPDDQKFYTDDTFTTPMQGNTSFIYRDAKLYLDGIKNTIPYKYNSNTGRWEVNYDYSQTDASSVTHTRFPKGTYNTVSGVNNVVRGYLNTVSGVHNYIDEYSRLNTVFGNENRILSYNNNTSSVYGSFVEGYGNTVKWNYCHAEGYRNTVANIASHVEGYQNNVTGDYGAHAEGRNNTASGTASHVEGEYNTASGVGSHAEGNQSNAFGDYSHAEGNTTSAYYEGSHAEGIRTTANSNGAHAEGCETNATSNYAHAEGYKTRAWGAAAHAEGTAYIRTINNNNVVINLEAMAEGSHAEGRGTNAYAVGAHSEGTSIIWDEGATSSNMATATAAHSEGIACCAYADGAHAQNGLTIASSPYQTAIGRLNLTDQNNTYALIIGNGQIDLTQTKTANENRRSNALTVDWFGNVWTAGNVEIGGTPTANNHAVTLSILNKVLNNFADPYDDTSTYSIGDVVIYDYTLYKCNTSIGTPEDFDDTKWDAIKVNQI